MFRICAFSDTHTKHSMVHDDIVNSNADILIFAGDGSNIKLPVFNEDELRSFLHWMNGLSSISKKVFVPGNHDTSFETKLIEPEEYPNIDFLVNEEIVYSQGADRIKIYGSPITPSFGIGWAYNCDRQKIDKYWNKIPHDTDILVTHGPPKGILDYTKHHYSNTAESVGCKSLRNKVFEIKPKYHIFGHLHDETDIYNHGVMGLGHKCRTQFINASIVNLRHEVVNKPTIFEI